MDHRYRKAVIAGNWKMNMTPAQTRAFIDELKTMYTPNKHCEVVLCVPFVDIHAALTAARSSKIAIGAQNVHFEDAGAFTGEISAPMLKEMGVKYVIIGHSERRGLFFESDEIVRKKVATALCYSLRPILCVGESLAQREAGITLEWIRSQVKSALQGIEAHEARRIVFAYEPIWAIGTGQTATAEQASEIANAIRACLRELYGARVSRTISIVYGGSMNPGNAASLLAMSDIDGGLIGGASLKTEDFVSIVSAAHDGQ